MKILKLKSNSVKKTISAFLLIFTILSACTILPSCSPKSDNTPEFTTDTNTNSAFPYTFTDSTGNSLTLKEKPKVVAVLFSSFAEIWTLSGGEISVTVGDSIKRGFVEQDKDVTLVDDGAGHTSINREMLVSAMPDLVICTADYTVQAECASYLNSVGIPAAVFKVESVDDYLKVLKIFTDINQTPDIYREYGIIMKEKIDLLLEDLAEYTQNIEKNSILFIRAGSSAKSTKAKNSSDNFACKMLDELNTYNIADSASILLDVLSLEEIIAQDPEFIFITSMGSEEASKAYIDSLFEKDGWSSLSAVKSGKVIFLDKEMFHYKPNSRWYDAYKFLCNTIYPEFMAKNSRKN